MGALRRLAARLAVFVRPGRNEDALAREIAAHLALLEDEHRRRGLPPEEARRAARLALGGVERAKELHREARSIPWLEDARRDVHHAVRRLVVDRGLALTVTLTIGIAIGAATAVFSVVDAVLLRPLPYREPVRPQPRVRRRHRRSRHLHPGGGASPLRLSVDDEGYGSVA